MNRLPATELSGGIKIIRERDIRRRGKPFNDMIECEPMHCTCCGRAIYKIAELQNGDVLGSECACVIGILYDSLANVQLMRRGRFLNQRQQAYAIKNGLLKPKTESTMEQ